MHDPRAEAKRSHRTLRRPEIVAACLVAMRRNGYVPMTAVAIANAIGVEAARIWQAITAIRLFVKHKPELYAGKHTRWKLNDYGFEIAEGMK